MCLPLNGNIGTRLAGPAAEGDASSWRHRRPPCWHLRPPFWQLYQGLALTYIDYGLPLVCGMKGSPVSACIADGTCALLALACKQPPNTQIS